ncbi:hypothetical protein ONS95_004362 [Cadophora gregata]|uniref:uncharacterized protein n=1 Tax=Cadophora gregata TaxID=51156 RepID=UPI0026DB1520|nr:uncharacterized protein ONS95_004362 [Cadophora gregata]KAK0105848.1 hypothetical protein ONS95_004362 [Cadophora gregata]
MRTSIFACPKEGHGGVHIWYDSTEVRRYGGKAWKLLTCTRQVFTVSIGAEVEGRTWLAGSLESLLKAERADDGVVVWLQWLFKEGRAEIKVGCISANTEFPDGDIPSFWPSDTSMSAKLLQSTCVKMREETS